MIVPIPKGASCCGSPSSYHSISLLPVVSREAHMMYGLLSDHLAIAQPLSDHQWGFRSNRFVLLSVIKFFFVPSILLRI